MLCARAGELFEAAGAAAAAAALLPSPGAAPRSPRSCDTMSEPADNALCLLQKTSLFACQWLLPCVMPFKRPCRVCVCVGGGVLQEEGGDEERPPGGRVHRSGNTSFEAHRRRESCGQRCLRLRRLPGVTIDLSDALVVRVRPGPRHIAVTAIRFKLRPLPRPKRFGRALSAGFVRFDPLGWSVTAGAPQNRAATSPLPVSTRARQPRRAKRPSPHRMKTTGSRLQ